MPHLLPQGYCHFSIARLELVMTPLPSLSITYTVSHPTQLVTFSVWNVRKQVQPLVAHIETAQKICYQLSVGSHTLRFNPREHQVQSVMC